MRFGVVYITLSCAVRSFLTKLQANEIWQAIWSGIYNAFVHASHFFFKIAKKDFNKLAQLYGLTCKQLIENQKQRIDYWENIGNKKIK